MGVGDGGWVMGSSQNYRGGAFDSSPDFHYTLAHAPHHIVHTSLQNSSIIKLHHD